jgi:hypothetical protein
MECRPQVRRVPRDTTAGRIPHRVRYTDLAADAISGDCRGGMMLEKIVSGGQTGVDRAALDVALQLGIPCGGWCPEGRRAEDGGIPSRYPLQETASSVYRDRTERNVRDSDATLVLTIGPPRGGTATTIRLAAQHHRPCLVLDLSQNPGCEAVRAWLNDNGIATLNVAGPRESGVPGIHGQASDFLRQCLVDRAATASPPRRPDGT